LLEAEGGDVTKNSQDELTRAYAMLSALRDNINKVGYPIEEKFVYKYHSVLDSLEKCIGKNLSEFRIPDSEIYPSMSGEMCVDRVYMLTNMDAVLSYFEIITSETPRRIGFRTSQE
jgi:hypothetical protein